MKTIEELAREAFGNNRVHDAEGLLGPVFARFAALVAEQCAQVYQVGETHRDCGCRGYGGGGDGRHVLDVARLYRCRRQDRERACWFGMHHMTEQQPYIPSDWLRLATMSALQEQCAERGICPKCHKYLLRQVHEESDMRFTQCADCLDVYVLNAKE